MTEQRRNATYETVDEPYAKVDEFNVAYKMWMTSLQKQMPELHDDFSMILDRLHVADARDQSYPMHIFQWYTGPYTEMILKNDPAFFDAIARDSKGKSMPIAFKDHFLRLSGVQQIRAWKTLEYLMRLTAKVYKSTYILPQY